jgi:5'-3' exonuclease
MRLHLVDGTYELFRAHFSKRPSRRNPAGKDVKATVGVVSSLVSLLHETGEGVTHLAVAFDNPIRSFRNTLFAGYKTEAGVPEELLAQFDDVEAGVAALGVTVWSMRDHEADDALASGARMFRDSVDQVRIMTPDKDLGQCIVGTRVVQVDRMRNKLIDEPALLESKGVAPASIPDLLALTGDSADGVPGIPGWGAVSAATVLREYQFIENIPDDVRTWKVKVRGADRLATALTERRPEAMLYKKLTTLVDDLKLARSLDDLAVPGVPRERFMNWCSNIAVDDIAPRITRWI